MRRRDVIAALGGAAGVSVVRPFVTRAQPSLPVIGFVNPGTPEAEALNAAAFRKGLAEAGFVEGQNVNVDYRWLDGQYARLPIVLADMIRRPVAVIATPGFQVASLAAKAATTTIPIVFGVADDPVQLGLVTSLAQPGGNATGMNQFAQEVGGKRLRLLHEMVPKAVRLAVIVNSANVSATEVTLRDVKEAAPVVGMEIQTILNAKTVGEIDAAFATLARERPDALFVGPDGFYTSRAVQFSTLAAVHKIPATYTNRFFVSAGGLMSYGTDQADMYHQVGIYSGRILKGEKPANLPVLQSTKFELAINRQTARALDIEVPSGLLAIADEVIE